MLEYRRTTDLSSTDMDWLNSELYALLAIKTSDTAMGSVKSLEEVEVQGFIGWQRLEREAEAIVDFLFQSVHSLRGRNNQFHTLVNFSAARLAVLCSNFNTCFQIFGDSILHLHHRIMFAPKQVNPVSLQEFSS